MRVWTVRGVGVGAVSLLVAAMATSASATGASSWDFSEVAPGAAVAPSQVFAGPVDLYAADTTTLTGVAHGGGSALDFNAWRNLSPGQSVDKVATMLSTDPGFASDRKGGSDSASTSFDPGTGDFTLSVWLLPTPASAFPRGSLKPSKISPNVVQNGRANATGGYWKLFLQMSDQGGGQLAWVPDCVFKGPDGTMARTNQGRSAVPMVDGVGYTLTCSRISGVLSLTMTPDGGTPLTLTSSDPATMSVDNAYAVSVGHKPGSTDPTDVYDGELDSLSISVG